MQVHDIRDDKPLRDTNVVMTTSYDVLYKHSSCQ